MLNKLVGDRAFYKRLFVLILPIMIQNGITNLVSMLDNIMIGSLGTAEMTGVAVTNQLFFVFTLCVFGAVSGAGIFGAQYFGNKDYEGVHYTYRFKLMFGGLLAIASILLFVFFGESILSMYMQGEGGETDPVATLGFAKEYMMIMLIGLIPFTIVQCYSSTLREGGYPTLPMIAGVVAVFVNLALNYMLIFGNFGAPKMGVAGAAIATVISRFVELIVVVTFSHFNKQKYPFIKGIYRSLYVPSWLIGRLFIKGMPLMINETLWASGVAMVNQCYSEYGLDSVAAINISQTFWNVFSIAHIAVGTAVGIILGQLLGANKLKEAKEQSYKLISSSFAIAIVVGAIYLVSARYIPMAYNIENVIREIATNLMVVTALIMPFEALTHATYFTLRSGGKMLITIIFDCVSMWCVNVPIAFVVSRYTDLSFLTLFIIIQCIAIVKGAIGIWLVKEGSWVKNIIDR